MSNHSNYEQLSKMLQNLTDGQIYIFYTRKKREIFIGELESKNLEIIRLQDPVELISDTFINGIIILQIKEIVKIQQFRANIPIVAAVENQNENEDNKKVNSIFNTKSIVKLVDIEWLQLKKQLSNIHYINRANEKYFQACTDIKRQLRISITVEPKHKGRLSKPILIVISTYEKVYIFDINELGRLNRGLPEILTAINPLKIVHYSPTIVDMLNHYFKFELSSVVDTFVAYCLLNSKKEFIELPQAIEETFNFPAICLEKKKGN